MIAELVKKSITQAVQVHEGYSRWTVVKLSCIMPCVLRASVA